MGSGRLCSHHFYCLYISGGIGYAFIFCMAADIVRPDRCGHSARRVARPAPHGRLLSLVSVHGRFGKRIPDMPLYPLFLVPLLAVMRCGLIAMASARTPRRSGGIAARLTVARSLPA